MKKTERLLHLCADSMKMPGWNDSLERITENVMNKCTENMLSDEELQMVAGGIVKESNEKVQ